MNFINCVVIKMHLIVVPIEAAVFLKEHLNNWYSLRSYYSVKIITDFVMQVCSMQYYSFVTNYIKLS